jgi:hypothetical protein
VKAKRKSSYSGASGGNCVVVGSLDSGEGVAVEDSKDKGRGPELAFPITAWREFTRRVQSGR